MKPGLRERKRAATHTSITQAAMRLFADRGYDAVTVDEIADACDVSPRTFFRYFGTKEEVLFAEGEARREHLLELVAAQPPGVRPFAAIADASRAMADLYAGERDQLALRSAIIASASSLQPRDAELPRRWDRDIAQLMRSTGRAGGMSDLELMLEVGASMTALRVAIQVWIHDEHTDLHELIDEGFGRLAAGFAAGS